MLEFLAALFNMKPTPISKREIGSGSNGVAATLLYMKKLIIDSDKDRIVKETAKNIVKDIDPKDHLGQAKAIVAWVRKHFKYVRDIYNVEELTDPVVILHNLKNGVNSHSSDCDDFAILISALLRSIGFRTRLEAVGIGQEYYNHARLSAFIVDKWYTIEGTKNVPVGYAQPSVIPIMFVEVA